MGEGIGAEERRYEEERRARIRHRNRISGRLVLVIMAAALALLGYDSAIAALAAHRDGRSFGYPLALSAGCAAVLIAAGLRTFAHRRRR
ncbi:hypothetical protein [Actinomadura alba]|uniref:Uncharacterized protein n=1 Tax=Actinomadura alba TaxID=406431 RepID=A0ABR7LLF3_9ACTN|nr:hypothetical protein [Actinomadura alba]MBC6465653.1 hypothetical protein [Actinomadura alba]